MSINSVVAEITDENNVTFVQLYRYCCIQIVLLQDLTSVRIKQTEKTTPQVCLYVKESSAGTAFFYFFRYSRFFFFFIVWQLKKKKNQFVSSIHRIKTQKNIIIAMVYWRSCEYETGQPDCTGGGQSISNAFPYTKTKPCSFETIKPIKYFSYIKPRVIYTMCSSISDGEFVSKRVGFSLPFPPLRPPLRHSFIFNKFESLCCALSEISVRFYLLFFDLCSFATRRE